MPHPELYSLDHSQWDGNRIIIISAATTCCFSLAAKDMISINDMFAIVGDERCSFGMYSRCGLPSTQERPFTRPSRFPLSRSMGLSSLSF